MQYTCYNLIISSDIALPELLPQSREAEVDEPDVRISLGRVGVNSIKHDDVVGLERNLSDSAGIQVLNVPDIGLFIVCEGRKVIIDPIPGVDEDSIRLFLLGTVFGVLLFQRKMLVLHGNAVRIGNRCVVCVGDSGSGKSTLAAGFMRRGYDILADDVVPIGDGYHALPGFPRIKLWRDTIDQLGIDADSLKHIRPGVEKFNYPLFEQFADKRLPVRWIYVLEKHDKPEIVFEPISGFQSFKQLYKNTFGVHFIHNMAIDAEHLEFCAGLARNVRLARVIRPQQGFELEMLIDHILTDIANNH